MSFLPTIIENFSQLLRTMNATSIQLNSTTIICAHLRNIHPIGVNFSQGGPFLPCQWTVTAMTFSITTMSFRTVLWCFYLCSLGKREFGASLEVSWEQISPCSPAPAQLESWGEMNQSSEDTQDSCKLIQYVK